MSTVETIQHWTRTLQANPQDGTYTVTDADLVRLLDQVAGLVHRAQASVDAYYDRTVGAA